MADGFAHTFGRVDFLGIGFTPLSIESAADAIAARARTDCPFAYVSMPNLDHVVGLDSEPATRARLYSDSWLALNNSRALQFFAKLSGAELPALSGADLAQALLARAILPDDPVVILGGDAELVAALAARYRLNNVQWRPAPKMELGEGAAEMAAFIARAKPRYAFICLGAPQQERIARAALHRGDATGVALCVGDGLETLRRRMLRAGLLERLRLAARRVLSWRVLDALRILPIWYYWRRAQWLGERASISARRAF